MSLLFLWGITIQLHTPCPRLHSIQILSIKMQQLCSECILLWACYRVSQLAWMTLSDLAARSTTNCTERSPKKCKKGTARAGFDSSLRRRYWHRWELPAGLPGRMVKNLSWVSWRTICTHTHEFIMVAWLSFEWDRVCASSIVRLSAQLIDVFSVQWEVSYDLYGFSS